MKVFIAGEGSDEIGDWAGDPAYLPAAPFGGVVEALLRQVRTDGWIIGGGGPWKRIRQIAVGRDLHGRERRRVLGVINQALEAGCDVVAFVRDQDGEVDRELVIENAIQEARTLLGIGVIGGVAIQELDSWILAILGEPGSETMRQPKPMLSEKYKVQS